MKMKRFLALFLCLTMLLSLLPTVASAEDTLPYYLAGDFLENWAGVEVLSSKNGDSSYPYYIDYDIPAGGQFKVHDNAGHWYPSGDNISNSSVWKLPYHIEIDSNSEVTYRVADEDGYYLVGDMNNWLVNSNYKLSQFEGTGYYYINTSLETKYGMKIISIKNGAFEWASPDNNYYPGLSGEARVYFYPAGERSASNGWDQTVIKAASAADAASDGFYLVGTDFGMDDQNTWLTLAEHKFSSENNGKLVAQGTAGHGYKAVLKLGNVIEKWYPEGNNNDLILRGSESAQHYYRFTCDLKGDNGITAEEIVYPVTFSPIQGGSNSTNGYLTVTAGDQSVADGDYFPAGTELVVTAHPAEGYQCTKIEVNKNSGISTINSGDTYTMLAEDVYFEATFSAIPAQMYDLYIFANRSYQGTLGSGSVTVTVGTGEPIVLEADGAAAYYASNPLSVAPGTQVTVAVTAGAHSSLFGGGLVRFINGISDEDLDVDLVNNTYSFTMPEGEVTIDPVFMGDEQYTYTVGTHANGSLTVNDNDTSATVYEGESITIVAQPNAGYGLTSIQIGNNTITSGWDTTTYTYVAQNVTSNATVNATFTQTTYEISTYIETNDNVNSDGGSVTVQASAAPGATVNVTVAENAGYRLKSLHVQKYQGNWSNDTDITTTKSFTMPGEEVRLFAKFESVYTVEVDPSITHGSVTVDKYVAAQGELITVTVTPDEGYRLAEGSLKYYYFISGAGWVPASAISGNTFNMDAYNVQIRAAFELIPPTAYAITKAVNTNPGVTAITTNLLSVTVSNAAVTEAVAGAEVTVSATEEPDGWWYLGSISVKTASGEDVLVSNGTFRMPAEAVTVTANYLEPQYVQINFGGQGTGKVTVTVNGVSTDYTTSVDDIAIRADATVSITATADTGSTLFSISEDHGVDLSGEFSMPARDLGIWVRFDLEDGYYLVGSMTNWGDGITAAEKLTKGEGGLYYIDRTFAQSDLFKVVYSNNGQLTYIPDAENDRYEVPTAGAVRVYFDPNERTDQGWWFKHIRVENGFYLNMEGDSNWNWREHPLTLENGEFATTQVFGTYLQYKIVGVYNYNRGDANVVWFGTDNNGHNGDSNYSVSEAGTYKITFNRSTASATLIEAAPAKVKAVAKNLELNGNIGINFKLVLPADADASKVVAQFYINGVAAGEGINLGDLTVDKEGYYVVKYEFAAKEVNQEVTLKVTVDGELSLWNSSDEDVSEDGITTSVKAMCDQYESSGMGTEVVTLAHKIEDYGAYAAHYFSGSAGTPSGVTPLTEDQITAADNGIQEASRTKTVSVVGKIKLKSIYLTLESETTLNLRFEALGEDELSSFLFYLVDDETETLLDGANVVGNVVKIKNIAAKNLCKKYTVRVKQGDTVVYTVTCSAMYYAKLVLSSTSESATEELKNLMRALYLYWDAANAYFD